MGNEVLSTETLRHGAYICLTVPSDARARLATVAVPALADRLKLRNEFETEKGHPPDAIASVGGNRYGWFANEEIPELAIDNSQRSGYLLDLTPATARNQAGTTHTVTATIATTSIIQRLAEPQEVAAMVAYACSDLASATTGATLRVEGGIVESIA